MNEREKYFRKSSLIIALLAIFLGGLVIIGWWLGIESLKSVMPGLVTMKYNTALLFILTGVSLWVYWLEKPAPTFIWLGKAASLTAVLVALLTIIEYVMGLNLGLDQFFFAEPAGAVLTRHLGRMAMITAIEFMLLNTALILTGKHFKYAITQALALGAAFIAFQSLIGYLLSAKTLYIYHQDFSAMALHTAIMFFLLSLGILFARPREGLMQLVTADTSAGQLLRQLFPLALILPPFFGWLKLVGERSGIVPNELGVSLVAILNAITFSGLLWFRAATMQKLDSARLKAETKALEIQSRAKKYLEIAGVIIVAIGKQQEVLLVNKKAVEALGYQEKELIGKNWFDLIIPQEDRERVRNVYFDLMSGKVAGVEYVENLILTKQGEKKLIGWHNSVLKDEQGGIMATISSGEDITMAKQARLVLEKSALRMQKLLELNQMQSKSLKEITTFALEACVAITGSQVGFFHYFDEANKDITLNAWSKNVMPECSANQDQHYPLSKAGIWADCVRTRQPVIVNDYAGAAGKKGFPEGHFPVKNFLSLPVFDGDKVVMVCGVGNKAGLYTQADIDELNVFMANAWLVIKEFWARQSLNDKIAEIQKQNELMVGRELKMIELKTEINALRKEAGQPEKYSITNGIIK